MLAKLLQFLRLFQIQPYNTFYSDALALSYEKVACEGCDPETRKKNSVYLLFKNYTKKDA